MCVQKYTYTKVNMIHIYVVRLLHCDIDYHVTLGKIILPVRTIYHTCKEENNTTRGIGYSVSEAFLLFVVDAILGNDLCDIKVHITAEIENPKNCSPLSL